MESGLPAKAYKPSAKRSEIAGLPSKFFGRPSVVRWADLAHNSSRQAGQPAMIERKHKGATHHA